MKIYSLWEDDKGWFLDEAETAMCLHALRKEHLRVPIYVLGGQYVIDLSEEGERADELLRESWMSSSTNLDEARESYLGWIEGLDRFQIDRAAMTIIPMGFRIRPLGPYPRAPSPPSWIYGHLPYIGVCDGTDVFYRWEASPISSRIDQTTGKIAKGIFAAPASEVPLVPSGFAAVGRYALPMVTPYNWRWELQPAAGTIFRCGASVPLFGQSGGGVEVMFPNAFTNVGPIPDPVVLSPL